MTAHVHDIFATGHRTVKLIWAVFAVIALGVAATVIVLLSTSTGSDSTPAPEPPAPVNVTSHAQVANDNACGPTRIVHPC
jgi:hypothetical protein